MRIGEDRGKGNAYVPYSNSNLFSAANKKNEEHLKLIGIAITALKSRINIKRSRQRLFH